MGRRTQSLLNNKQGALFSHFVVFHVRRLLWAFIMMNMAFGRKKTREFYSMFYCKCLVLFP